MIYLAHGVRASWSLIPEVHPHTPLSASLPSPLSPRMLYLQNKVHLPRASRPAVIECK